MSDTGVLLLYVKNICNFILPISQELVHQFSSSLDQMTSTDVYFVARHHWDSLEVVNFGSFVVNRSLKPACEKTGLDEPYKG